MKNTHHKRSNILSCTCRKNYLPIKHLFAATQKGIFSKESIENKFISCNKRVPLDLKHKKGRVCTALFYPMHMFPLFAPYNEKNNHCTNIYSSLSNNVWNAFISCLSCVSVYLFQFLYHSNKKPESIKSLVNATVVASL